MGANNPPSPPSTPKMLVCIVLELVVRSRCLTYVHTYEAVDSPPN